VDPFLAAVRRTMAAHEMAPPDARFLVALSGGADSVALLAALRELGYPLVAAHFNHGWRGEESERDQRFAQQLCERLAVELAVGRAGPPGGRRPGGGLEQAAREQRYAFLLAAARAAACTRVATGHTRDDQAETVVLRLLRGSGATGLAGIQPARADGVVRPLLDLGRDDVLAYLDRRGLAWVEDSSNRDPRFRRNRLRLEVMPALRRLEPRADEVLATVAREMRARAELERRLGEELLRRCLAPDDGLDLARVARAADRVLVLRAWLLRRRGHLRRLGAAHFDALARCDRSGARVQLPRGESVANEHGLLRHHPAQSPPADPEISASLALGAEVRFGAWRLRAEEVGGEGRGGWPADLSHALLDAELAALPLRVRRWRAGDRIQPLGMRGHRKLSDVFIDAKLPRWQRHSVPVVESGDRILWVPGVVRAADAAVGASSRRLVALSAVRR